MLMPTSSTSPPLFPTRVQKYELKVPKITLDDEALAKLEKGQPVKKQIQAAGKSGGRGIVIQDINAPPAVVMDRILDFGNYNKMVPNVAQCGNYATAKLRNVSGGAGG